MRPFGWETSLAVLGLMLAPYTALAQEVPAGSVGENPDTTPASASADARFVPADFARFAPRTALDMVDKIPGFTIVSGDNGGDRGLGNARENVLINGERIANKSTDARAALSRITADQVAYIEIIDGASVNVPGLTGQVANVVLTAGSAGGFKTTFRWEPEIRPRLQPNWFAGEVSTTGKVGDNNITISLTNQARRNGHWGPERVFGSNGDLLFIRDEFASYDADQPRLTGALARTSANGNKLNLNIGGQLNNSTNQSTGTSIQAGAGVVGERFRFTEREWSADIGGDYEFALGGGRMKLIALKRVEHSPTIATFVIDQAVGGQSGTRFTQMADESESILRSEYGWRTASGTDWQLALEGAFNTLDVDAEFAALQPDGRFLSVPFGGERTRVQEKRADLSLSWGRALSSNLTAQVNIGAEYSELASSGPGGLTRRFVRPKGKLALAWKIGDQTTINYQIQRRVEQLNFFDFASSVDVANNQGNAGNADLVPPQITRAEFEVVQDFRRWGHASLAISYARAIDLVDQIPLSPTTEGRGNLPAAHLYNISSKATLLLDPMGWKGARINSEIAVGRNRVRDPLTNAWREQSGSQLYAVDIGLRHDIPGSAIAWGGDFSRGKDSRELRLDSIEHPYSTRPFVTAFVEHKDVAGLTVRASLRNLLGSSDGFDRTVYANRRDGPVAFRESRIRGFGQLFQLTVSGTI